MNLPVIEATAAHLAARSKEYVSAATTALALILQSEIHISEPAHTYLAIALIIGSFFATFVIPSKNGPTLGEAVASDGELFQQAAQQLHDVPLPGPVAAAVEKAATVEPVVAQAVEAAVPGAIPFNPGAQQ